MGSYSRRAYYVHGSGQVWRRRYSNVVVVVAVAVLTELVLGLVFYAAVILAITYRSSYFGGEHSVTTQMTTTY